MRTRASGLFTTARFSTTRLSGHGSRLPATATDHCDTETIVHAYEEFGPSCVQLFRGMFAFAIWDKQARRLFVHGDRLGKKPFYYFWNGQLFAFASEIKALLEHPEISAEFETAFSRISGFRLRQ